jgi:hypothetical protein
VNRALVASTIALFAVGLPAGPVVAHDCPCFPPGEWFEVELPPGIAALSPEAATAVPDGVLIFGRTDDGAELAASLLTLPDPGDALLGGDASSNDVLVGGNIAMEGLGVPFLSFSSDGGQTWIGDPIDDGGTLASGSTTIFVNGQPAALVAVC